MESRRPAIAGEVLFDCFADETTLGGAPFNVAWHLAGLGFNPLFISRVGDDALGVGVREAMDRWGMDPAALQSDPQRPTGQVRVTLDAGQPRYEILPEQAYDHVDWTAATATLGAQPPALLYHGTLALRRQAAADGLLGLRRRVRTPVFVDVNLRAPWWNGALVSRLLEGVEWVKLNDAELAELAGVGVSAADYAGRLGLKTLILTRGAAGATALADAGEVAVAGVAVADMVDAVGAGDAFAAITLVGLLNGWTWQRTLSRAATFAARVCTHRGAIREERALYDQTLEAWANDG